MSAITVLTTGPMVHAAGLSYVGSQANVELSPDDPTVGWRNPTPVKPLDIDGDNVLGTDGYRLSNLGIGGDPSYVRGGGRLVPNSESSAFWGLMDNPVIPFGADTIPFGYSHAGDANEHAIFSIVMGLSPTPQTVLRLGVLFDGYDGTGSQTLRLEQTVGIGDGNSVSSPLLAYNADGLDVALFDISNWRFGDAFTVFADADSGISHVSGATFDTVIPEPSSFALLGLGGLLIARRRRG